MSQSILTPLCPREEVRAAFMAFMREKEEERKAAEIRLELYHQKRLAGLV